jgi:AraC-like DNA-binding protein
VDPEGRETRAVRLSAPSLLAVRGLAGRLGRGPDLGVEESALLAFRQLAADTAPGPATGSTRLSGAARAALERVRTLLAARPYDRIGLDAIGREVGRSPYQLAREFRSTFGTSIHQHRLRLRLAGALDRLAQGETDLARLALETGFASHSHLTATVVRVFGASPSVLRASLVRGRREGLRTILKAPLPSRA